MTMQHCLVARCRSAQTFCIRGQPCNICRSAWLDVVAPVQTAFRYALLVLHRDCQAAYFELTHTLSVFPPRAIQKARPPTGPSLRLGIPGSLVNAKRVAGVRRLFPGVGKVPCCTTRGSVLSKHLITLGGSTSFCSSTDKPPLRLIRHAENGVGAISARPSSSASPRRERGSEESIRPSHRSAGP